MYSKYGRVVKERNVFDRMTEKDLVAWNSMVSGYAQLGFAREALGLVEEMKINGEIPNLLTWNSLIVGFALIAGFAQVGDEVMVLDMFRMMWDNGVQPDVYSLTLVISGSVQNIRNNQAFDMFKRSTCLSIQHGYALVSGIEEDVFVSSVVIDMYLKCGAIFEYEILFKKMSTINTVTWYSLIFGYANHGYSIKAIELFNDMTEKKGCRAGELVEAYELIKNMPIKPDLFVWGTLFRECRNHGNVELAEITAKHASELEPRSVKSSLLMSSLYADNGNWGDAERLKKVKKKKRIRRNVGCSWIGITT
ncbi:hypothetical protein GIB67_023699 [Kingdonia uniflora]|uniref:Pentatricopeptide repeat-containing protein n=1 Tax=Kingdonia uniflora TaxID=39325 RepID=A0A7J7MGH3_9MAGN|nr:hypothetical protein GIB67_023699 [Kingdonia uniflora]